MGAPYLEIEPSATRNPPIFAMPGQYTQRLSYLSPNQCDCKAQPVLWRGKPWDTGKVSGSILISFLYVAFSLPGAQHT